MGTAMDMTDILCGGKDAAYPTATHPPDRRDFSGWTNLLGLRFPGVGRRRAADGLSNMSLWDTPESVLLQ